MHDVEVITEEEAHGMAELRHVIPGDDDVLFPSITVALMQGVSVVASAQPTLCHQCFSRAEAKAVGERCVPRQMAPCELAAAPCTGKGFAAVRGGTIPRADAAVDRRT